MANHVTAAERAALVEAAREITELDSDGSILNFRATAEQLAAEQGVSFQRAQAAVARVARQMRHPGRPRNDEPLERYTVTLTTANVETAKRLGHGKVSAGVRLALETIDAKEDTMKKAQLVNYGSSHFGYEDENGQAIVSGQTFCDTSEATEAQHRHMKAVAAEKGYTLETPDDTLNRIWKQYGI